MVSKYSTIRRRRRWFSLTILTIRAVVPLYDNRWSKIIGTNYIEFAVLARDNSDRDGGGWGTVRWFFDGETFVNAAERTGKLLPEETDGNTKSTEAPHTHTHFHTHTHVLSSLYRTTRVTRVCILIITLFLRSGPSWPFFNNSKNDKIKDKIVIEG